MGKVKWEKRENEIMTLEKTEEEEGERKIWERGKGRRKRLLGKGRGRRDWVRVKEAGRRGKEAGKG